MKQAVTRTRENLAERIDDIVSIGKEIDRNTLDDLEATLIGADLGSTTTQEVLGKLREFPRHESYRLHVSLDVAEITPEGIAALTALTNVDSASLRRFEKH